jgi:transcriptional regulator with XRE-family HTH domain
MDEMKVGVKISLFNWRLRERRLELGLSQVRLAEILGTHPTKISDLELFKKPQGDWPSLLYDVADYLELPFDEVFPPDYITFLETGPGLKRSGMTFVREMSIARLIESHERLLLPSAEDEASAGLLEEQFAQTIEDVLSSLTPTEKTVIQMRYGLGEYEPMALEPVGAHFGVTRERIRQIEQKALRKMSHPSRSKALRDFIGNETGGEGWTE